MSDIKPTMLLISSPWQGRPSFKLMPMSKECVFTEGIFDPENKVLVMLTNDAKETLHMVPRLTDDGEIIPSKVKRASGKSYKEQRVQLETFTEHYIHQVDEIQGFIDMVAINASAFNFKQYFHTVETKQPATPVEVS